MSVLSELRKWMIQENIDYFLVPSTDEYLNEYIPLKQNGRYFVTEFTGSTGDALIGKFDAHLFVDGRYHKQADDEVCPNHIKVCKLKLGESQKEAITNLLQDRDKLRLGIISTKMSYFSFCALQKELPNIEFVEYKNDIILELAKAPLLAKETTATQIKLNISGLSADEKLAQIQENLNEKYFVITKLDEISYLTNLRNYDVAYSSSIKAKAIVDAKKCIVFTDHKVKKIGENFLIKPEDEFFEYLKNIQDKVLISTTSLNLKTFRAIEKCDLTEVTISPIARMKAIKNSAELKHIQKCFKKTDRVIAKIQKWLRIKSKKTEQDLSSKICKYYKRKWAKGLSFKTIAAAGTNSAVVHYSNPTDKLIENGMILIDCGAYFRGGYATDITQTFFLGDNPSKEHKTVYTTVLKGFIAGANFKLKKTSTGQDLDKAVRKIIDKKAPEGFSFSHSTGHGIGISVHENPPFITSSIWGKDILEPGMCFSIEPGLYKDNSFGVRIERVVYVDENRKIVPLSKAPFDKKLIDHKMLSKKELQWLKDWMKG